MNWQERRTGRYWRNHFGFGWDSPKDGPVCLATQFHARSGERKDLQCIDDEATCNSTISIFSGNTCQQLLVYSTCSQYSPADRAGVSSSNHHCLIAVLKTWWSEVLATITLTIWSVFLSSSRPTWSYRRWLYEPQRHFDVFLHGDWGCGVKQGLGR